MAAGARHEPVLTPAKLHTVTARPEITFNELCDETYAAGASFMMFKEAPLPSRRLHLNAPPPCTGLSTASAGLQGGGAGPPALRQGPATWTQRAPLAMAVLWRVLPV